MAKQVAYPKFTLRYPKDGGNGLLAIPMDKKLSKLVCVDGGEKFVEAYSSAMGYPELCDLGEQMFDSFVEEHGLISTAAFETRIDGCQLVRFWQMKQAESDGQPLYGFVIAEREPTTPEEFGFHANGIEKAEHIAASVYNDIFRRKSHFMCVMLSRRISRSSNYELVAQTITLGLRGIYLGMDAAISKTANDVSARHKNELRTMFIEGDSRFLSALDAKRKLDVAFSYASNAMRAFGFSMAGDGGIIRPDMASRDRTADIARILSGSTEKFAVVEATLDGLSNAVDEYDGFLDECRQITSLARLWEGFDATAWTEYCGEVDSHWKEHGELPGDVMDSARRMCEHILALPDACGSTTAADGQKLAPPMLEEYRKLDKPFLGKRVSRYDMAPVLTAENCHEFLGKFGYDSHVEALLSGVPVEDVLA